MHVSKLEKCEKTENCVQKWFTKNEKNCICWLYLCESGIFATGSGRMEHKLDVIVGTHWEKHFVNESSVAIALQFFNLVICLKKYSDIILEYKINCDSKSTESTVLLAYLFTQRSDILFMVAIILNENNQFLILKPVFNYIRIEWIILVETIIDFLAEIQWKMSKLFDRVDSLVLCSGHL